MPWCVRNFHVYKEIDIPRLNEFMQHLNLNFPLPLENIDNRALNTLAIKLACVLIPFFNFSLALLTLCVFTNCLLLFYLSRGIEPLRHNCT